MYWHPQNPYQFRLSVGSSFAEMSDATISKASVKLTSVTLSDASAREPLVKATCADARGREILVTTAPWGSRVGAPDGALW